MLQCGRYCRVAAKTRSRTREVVPEPMENDVENNRETRPDVASKATANALI